jgi:thiamine pyrophosphate-dependent acetolactate synthase large subunit-like protein
MGTNLDRRAFVARLLENRGGLLVIGSVGSPTYDVAACGDDAKNFYIWSGLGSTPSVGLGLALAQPKKRVVVVTGDGDVLMALGSLATIGVKQPKNLIIVCLDNGHYSASGMQPTATKAGVDLAEAARACKLRVEVANDLSSAERLREALHTGEGPLFIHALVDADDQPRVIPSRDGVAIRQRFMDAIGAAI